MLKNHVKTETNQLSLKGNGLSVNPKSILKKDDFMKLLLTELQHQDPTSPMDSDKILSQTSQLATLESQDKTNKALEALTASFAGNKNFAAVSAIGKYAKLDNKIKLTNNQNGEPNPVNFELNFFEDVSSGTIKIYDENSYLVKTIKLDKHKAGKQQFTWNGTNDAGENAKSGSYKIVADYYNDDGVKLKADSISHKIESVKFEEGKTYVKIDGAFIPFEQISEIFEKKSNSQKK